MKYQPKRIQRKRTKGWKMPENTISVTRPGKYGNPFRVGHHYKKAVSTGTVLGNFIWVEAYEGYQDKTYTTIKTTEEAIKWFEWYLTTYSERQLQVLRNDLKGKDLACWCPLDKSCHADILLKYANK